MQVARRQDSRKPARGPRRRPRVPPVADLGARLKKVRRAMAAADIPSLLLCKPANIRYLTGFTGSSAILLIGQHAATFITDGRYDQQSHEELAAAGFVGDIAIDGAEGLSKTIREAAASLDERRVAVEADGASWAFVLQLKKWLRGFRIEPASNVVERVRASKDAWEISRLEYAARLTDAAFGSVIEWIAPGVTEREVARRLVDFFEDAGAEGISFEPIVATGPRSALPHARPTDAKIARGDLVVLDFGCRVDGYCSDMTRTVFVGTPDRDSRKIYSVVRSANEEGIRAVSANRMGRTIDAAARAVISSAGLGDRFVHSTGHGLGLEVHEWPRIGKGVGDRVPLDCVVTVEPGIYIPDKGGVRIEDMVVAGRGGHRVLTRSPTRLIAL